MVHADKGYDANALPQKIQEHGALANIPPKANRKWKNASSPGYERIQPASHRTCHSTKGQLDASKNLAEFGRFLILCRYFSELQDIVGEADEAPLGGDLPTPGSRN